RPVVRRDRLRPHRARGPRPAHRARPRLHDGDDRPLPSRDEGRDHPRAGRPCLAVPTGRDPGVAHRGGYAQPVARPLQRGPAGRDPPLPRRGEPGRPRCRPRGDGRGRGEGRSPPSSPRPHRGPVGVIAALLLLCAAALLTAPRLLVRIERLRRSPRAALFVWQALSLSAVLCLLTAAPLALVHRRPASTLLEIAVLVVAAIASVGVLVRLLTN